MDQSTLTNLSMNDFTKYFEAKKVGKLYFPNGKCLTPHGCAFENADITPFHIDLNDLYRIITKWKVNQSSVPLDDILAVVAFGSAVRHPGYEEVPIFRKKYLMFGAERDTGRTKKVPVQPSDADFLVITRRDLIKQEVLEPVSLETYDCGTWIKEGGIHLVNRGERQVINGAHTNDTVSITALNGGVPIFYDRSRLEEVVSRAGIPNNSVRKLFWEKNSQGNLDGRIE